MIKATTDGKTGIYKVFSAQTRNGQYYVQMMPKTWSQGVQYRLMHNRKSIYIHDYDDEASAISAMLEHLRRVLVQPVLFEN